MKNKVKWIMVAGIAVLLMVVIAGAAVLYHTLREDFDRNNLLQNSQA